VSDFGRRYLREYNNLCNIIFADMYKSIIAGTWSIYEEAYQRYNFFLYNESNTLNDEIEYEIYAKSGTRTIELLVVITDSCGVISIYIDNVLQGSVDLYSATHKTDTNKTIGIEVVGSKPHSLKIKVTGKNVASSGYNAPITHIRIK